MSAALTTREIPHPAAAGQVRLWAGCVVLAALLGAAPLLALPKSAHAFGFGVAPTTVEMEVRPGGRYRQVLTVGNVHPDRPLALTVGLADWRLDDDGGLQLASPGSTELTAAHWVRFSPSNLRLLPGESKQIVVDVQAPIELPHTGDHRVAVLITTLLPAENKRLEEGSGVWNRYMVTSLFYLTVPPAQSAAEVVDAELIAAGDGSRRLELRVKNRGNMHARLAGHATLVDASGETVHRQSISGVVLESQTRRLLVPMHTAGSELPPGRYDIALELRSDDGPIPVRVLELPFLDLDPSAPPASGAE